MIDYKPCGAICRVSVAKSALESGVSRLFSYLGSNSRGLGTLGLVDGDRLGRRLL